MKKYICSLFTGIALFLYGQGQTDVSKSASTPTPDSLLRYYARLAGSASEQDKAILENRLYVLLKSKEERDWLTARRFFYQMKKAAVADSIAQAVKAKFPKGELVRDEEVKAVFDEKDAAKKELLYQAWVKKFPPEKFGGSRIMYDYARNSVATAYASENNVTKAVEYANMTETGAWKGEGWAGVAYRLVKEGHTKVAKELLKKAIDNALLYKTVKKGEEGAGFAVMGLPGYASAYVDILVKEKNYTEALDYAKMAYEAAGKPRAGISVSYARILMALGREEEAFQKLDELVKAGLATAEVKEMLSSLYVKVKGSAAGFDEYMASVRNLLAAKVREDLAKKIVKEPAPRFALKDLNGKTVTAEELKGKIVVVDFWATWCGPCIRSFPAMKMAVEKYKNDPDVQFVFIHTWEREENPAAGAKAFVEKNGYTDFMVLMDTKDPVTGTNAVVESYKVNGIPAKFVLDKEGNIRFKLTGFEGGDDLAVEEISAMIELAGKN